MLAPKAPFNASLCRLIRGHKSAFHGNKTPAIRALANCAAHAAVAEFRKRNLPPLAASARAATTTFFSPAQSLLFSSSSAALSEMDTSSTVPSSRNSPSSSRPWKSRSSGMEATRTRKITTWPVKHAPLNWVTLPPFLDPVQLV